MRVLQALLFVSLVFISVPAFSRPVVWVAPSLVRVRPEAAAGEAASISLHAAKGEYESFQIIVRAEGSNLSSVRVSGGFEGGPTVTLYREHYVHVPVGSPDYASNRNKPEGAGWYPDALIPFVNPSTGRAVPAATPCSVEAGRNQPVWVDVFVPRETRAGIYRGAFTITSDQGEGSVSATLRVWNFALPVKPALKSCILYWPTANGGIGRGQTQPDEELLQNRLMPMSVNRADEARFAETLGLNATNAGFWSGADQSTGTMKPAPSVAECRQAARHAPGIFVYNYTADEIGSNPALYPAMQAWARNLHEAGIRNLVTMKPAPELYDDGSGRGRSAVDVWVLLPKMYDTARAQVAQVLGKGDEIWSYNANTQDDYSPKWEIDFAPINYRIQPGFISQSLGFTGLLYWRADFWTRDPWTDVTAMKGYPGEGLLVYPGAKVGLSGVVPSMRLKYLRDGVDDYDYVQLLKAQGEGEWALGVVRGVGKDWSDWTRDPAALEAARRELGERLDSGRGRS